MHVWSQSTVCVESHVGSEWGVRSAILSWNKLDGGPTFVMAESCPDYNNTVTVRYRNANDRFTGWTEWYWDTTGQLVHAAHDTADHAQLYPGTQTAEEPAV